MVVGDTRIVFVLKGPVYLVAVSKRKEPVKHLQLQLEHLHGCIVFVLTQKVSGLCVRTVVCLCPPHERVPPSHSLVGQIFVRLKKNPSYDMRNLLIGAWHVVVATPLSCLFVCLFLALRDVT